MQIIKLFEQYNYPEIKLDNVGAAKITDIILNYIDRQTYFGFFPFSSYKLKYDSISYISANIVIVNFIDMTDIDNIVQLKFTLENNKVRNVQLSAIN